ncbi:MAG: iron ABC transporter permease [Bacteroidales bacterium]|nr:iron ABC transporter permease [Bacteroidales bacterium]
MYRAETGKYLVLGFAFSAMVLAAAADLLFGGAAIGVRDVISALGTGPEGPATVLVRDFRLPRVLTALLCGMALSAGGLQMQDIFRNPLADPHIMGVSGGASLGAALYLMGAGARAVASFPYAGGCGLAQTVADGSLGLAGAAFLGAAAAALLMVAVSSRTGSGNVLLLFGVMLGFITGALVTMLQSGAGESALRLYCSWSAGSFSEAPWSRLILLLLFVAIGLAIPVFSARGLDAIQFGDDFTLMSGRSPRRIRTAALLSCCLQTGAVTAFCGPIGFVGIAAPHIARRLLGKNTTAVLLPVAVMCGGTLCACADLLVQASALALPAGSAMAIVGIPFVMGALMRR